MAIINGIIRKMAGSVGDFTFKQLNGQTVVSEKVTNMRNPRSDGQMKTRTKFTNIVAMYSLIRPRLRKAFETKPAGVSDYNMFMKVNMQKEPVYLTKQNVAAGACVAAPYQITQGSLPTIVTSGTGQNIKTDIYLGALTISASTTVAQFAKEVVDNNLTFQYGDQLTFFLVRQYVNAETSVPYVVVSSSKVVLDAADTTTKLWDIVNRVGFAASDSVLAHNESNFEGAFGWVHSRKSDGKTLVSSQSLVAVNATLLAEHQGDTAYSLSKSSYGASIESFLIPDGESTGGAGNAPSGGGNSGGGGGNDSL